MRFDFWFGITAVYVGLVALLWEICQERELLKRSSVIQVGAIALLFVFFDYFTIAVAAARAPLGLKAYVRQTNYPRDTVIAGIAWDSHFTDLRISVTNASSDDYQDLDISISPKPNEWTHKASIVESSLGCGLTPIEGGQLHVAAPTTKGNSAITLTPLGSGLDVYDSQGNPYETIATKPGYRLRCTRFPSNYTMQIVFAVVDVPESLRPNPGSTTISEVTGAKTVFDIFGPKPCSNQAVVAGTFLRGLKPYSIVKRIKVVPSC